MTDQAMSPLRRRMIEDMTIRKFAPKTQHDYMQRVNNFAAFLGRSPDTAGFEDARRYRPHLAANDVGLRIQLGKGAHTKLDLFVALVHHTPSAVRPCGVPRV